MTTTTARRRRTRTTTTFSEQTTPSLDNTFANYTEKKHENISIDMNTTDYLTKSTNTSTDSLIDTTQDNQQHILIIFSFYFFIFIFFLAIIIAILILIARCNKKRNLSSSTYPSKYTIR